MSRTGPSSSIFPRQELRHDPLHPGRPLRLRLPGPRQPRQLRRRDGQGARPPVPASLSGQLRGLSRRLRAPRDPARALFRLRRRRRADALRRQFPDQAPLARPQPHRGRRRRSRRPRRHPPPPLHRLRRHPAARLRPGRPGLARGPLPVGRPPRILRGRLDRRFRARRTGAEARLRRGEARQGRREPAAGNGG